MSTTHTLAAPAIAADSLAEPNLVPTTTSPAAPGALRVTGRRAFRSERMRLTGLRSTWAVAATTLVAMIGTAAAVAASVPADSVGDPQTS